MRMAVALGAVRGGRASGRRDGARESAWETTTTTDGKISTLPTTGRTVSITTTTVSSPRSRKKLDLLAPEQLGAPVVLLSTITGTDSSIYWLQIMLTLASAPRLSPAKGRRATGKGFQ